MKNNSLPASLIVAALTLCTGCSTFEKAWEEASKASTTGEGWAGGLAGRWQGTWLSEVNGHEGVLRCILSPEPNGQYLARYHATYGGAFTFSYEVLMAVEREADTWKFRGSADLGWLAGGVYTYVGQVKAAELFSTYASKSDQGTFRMTPVQ